MKFIRENIIYIIIIFLIIIIRLFIVTPVMVDGNSMYPTLKDNEILLLKKYDKKYDRFDIVVLKYNDEKLVKRIIGLPGEKVYYKHNVLYVDGKKVVENFSHDETDNFNITDIGYEKIPNDYYLVLGDNRDDSLDSRIIGLVSKEDIKGTVGMRLFPFNKFGKIE